MVKLRHVLVCGLVFAVLSSTYLAPVSHAQVFSDEVKTTPPSAGQEEDAAYGAGIGYLSDFQGAPIVGIGAPGADFLQGGTLVASGTFGGFGGSLVEFSASELSGPELGDRLGAEVQRLPSLDDGPTFPEYLLGAPSDDGGQGAAYVVGSLLTGSAAYGVINNDLIPQTLDADARLGTGLGLLNTDLEEVLSPETSAIAAVGAPGQDGTGAVYLVEIDDDGQDPIDPTLSYVGAVQPSVLATGDRFGASIARLGNPDATTARMAIGAPGSSSRGVVYILDIDITDASFTLVETYAPGGVESGDDFGSSGTVYDDGVSSSLLVGAPGTDGGTGSFYQLAIASDGSLSQMGKVGNDALSTSLSANDRFGASLATIPDQNGDSREEILVGAPGDDEVATNVGAFYTLFPDQGVLPVEFAGAPTAVADGRDVILSWRTLMEVSNAGFFVQHQRLDKPGGVEGRIATDGWTTASRRVESRASGGTSNSELRYDYRVTGLEPGRYAFRVRQVDVDGSEIFSVPTRAEVVSPEGLSLQAPTPNPVRGGSRATLEFSTRSTEVEAAIYNILGQQVRFVEVDGTSGAITVNTEDLSSGRYFVRMTAASGRSAVQSITVLK